MSTKPAINQGGREISVMAVLGEGLAAGMADFSIYRESQAASFPALLAEALGVQFRVPLLEPPGMGWAPGFTSGSVLVPAWTQSRVVVDMPPQPPHQLAIPGFTVSDSLHLRPNEPLVQTGNVRQTIANLILGMHRMPYGEAGLTQLESALALHPDLTLVALGYTEVLDAAVGGDDANMPDSSYAAGCWAEIVSSLQAAGSQVLLVNIPDPFDTAYFADLETASRILRIDADVLEEAYGLSADLLITVQGLNEIGVHFFGRAVEDLTNAATCSVSAADAIRARVAEWNRMLAELADRRGVWLYDLAGLVRSWRTNGVTLAGRQLSADYLGGLYTLNGYCPGATGHALIADDLLATLGRYGVRSSGLSCERALESDPAARHRPAAGRNWSWRDLPRPLPRRVVTANPPSALPPELPVPPTAPLRLPPGNEQVLPLNPAASYFGDGIAALNGRAPDEIRWASGGHWLFGGLAMVDSHLTGSLRIRFSDPVENRARFQLSFERGFEGEDAFLTTPVYFRMAFQQNRVDEVPGYASGGVVDLATGEVSDLTLYARYQSTALLSLVSVNPSFPKQPLSFPGQYGSAWARFEQRADGFLDFTFHGSTFVPLGDGIVWPLNFAGPELQFATIPANGTAMHPHLQLCTKESKSSAQPAVVDVPFDTIQEYTLHTHNSAFGDAFTLEASHLGGTAKGRSHVMGRLQVQFGSRTGDSVPVAISLLNPGGIFSDLADSPLTAAFPGRLSSGPQGFYELLRFPLRTYALDDLAILSDPFDISMGLLNLRTGRFLGPVLHRGFIHQDLIFALLRVEPRTPKARSTFAGWRVSSAAPAAPRCFGSRASCTYHIRPGFYFPTRTLRRRSASAPTRPSIPFCGCRRWVRRSRAPPRAEKCPTLWRQSGSGFRSGI